MEYRPNGFGTRRVLSGASLAQRVRRMNPPQRAVLAAEIIDGRIILQNLTAKSIAVLVGINLGYVDHALQLTPEQRAEVCRGTRPLISPRTRAPAPTVNWDAIDDNVLVEAVRRIGIERTLNAAVAAER